MVGWQEIQKHSYVFEFPDFWWYDGEEEQELCEY